MRKNIGLHIRELADAYALRTLHDYLVTTSFQHNLYFTGAVNFPWSKELLKDIPTKHTHKSIDSLVGILSDVRRDEFKKNSLLIDISLLKNSITPLSKDEKLELRERYNINSSKPVIVMGFGQNTSEEREVIHSFYNDATIYIVSILKPSSYRLSKDLKDVHLINKYGVLKDYYAMADISINARNLLPTTESLNNFVEATEGGPLFMVPSTDTNQYGYNELVKLGVIQECSDIKDIISRIKYELDTKTLSSNHTEKREYHLETSRDKYLPIINSFISELLGQDKSYDHFEELIIKKQTNKTLLTHTNTHWQEPHKSVNFFEQVYNSTVELFNSFSSIK